MDMTILDFDGRSGRALNLEGFLNYQKPVELSVLQKAVEQGKIIAISPQGQEKMNKDIEKAAQSDFEGGDLVTGTILAIKNFRKLLVNVDGSVQEFLVKAVEQKQDSDLEKGDEYYVLHDGIRSEKGVPLAFMRSGKEIKEALNSVVAKLQAENALLVANMATCVATVGIEPDEFPYDVGERKLGKRYSYEACEAFEKNIPATAGGETTISSAELNPRKIENACRAYNNYFYAFSSNWRSISLCNAYLANIKDTQNYQLQPNLYTLLFE